MDPLWNFFLQTVYYFYVGFIVMIIGVPIVFIWFWKKKMPRPAKTLFHCARKGYAPLLLVHDSGRADIVGMIERQAEGIVETTAGTFRILPRYAALPKEEELEAIKDHGLKEKMKEKIKALKDAASMVIDVAGRKFVLDVESWMSKRCWLLGMPTPLFVGYTGTLCLLNPEALALYEAGKLKIETGTETLFKGKKGEEDKAVKPLLMLDPRIIGEFISSYFHTSQISGVLSLVEERARIGLGANIRKLGKFLLIFVVVFVIILGVMYLPQFIARFGGR